jgi:hypothetical protein
MQFGGLVKSSKYIPPYILHILVESKVGIEYVYNSMYA